ncbi:chaperonin 10-like protein [Lasiosphaeris hirsuta]|uniref:Chaperonin 10-like protein n=1 Tax=Lasiosphaeris hirsuta TaxID=260670 RepID=A0AA40DRQ5_9PEZI|nr:chaperonin 10-like protein [Lasiosphaeris hirsuta]
MGTILLPLQRLEMLLSDLHPSPKHPPQVIVREIDSSSQQDLPTTTLETKSQTDPRRDSGASIAQPQTQTALVITPSRTYQLTSDFPAPASPGPGEVVIRTRAAGLNHIDWKSVEHNFCLPALPWVVGREMAGVVEGVGAGVEGVRRGDRVWTSTYYKDRRAGCFQELVVVPAHTVARMPANLGFASASCLGVGGLTAAMTLWRWLGLPMHPPPADGPGGARQVILIWGGSTVTGQFAVQLAAHVGWDVIAVCSDRTADLVRRLGPKHVVTYSGRADGEIVDEIHALGRGRISKAIDLVGPQTARVVLDVIARSEGVVDFAPLAFVSSKEAIPASARVHNVEMKQFVLDRASEVYAKRLNELVESGVVVIPKLRVIQGLGAVEGGLKQLKEGDLAGDKLVVSLSV